MENILIAIKSFLEAYGTSFIIMALAGFFIAFIVELGVKEAFKYLEETIGDKNWLQVARIAVIFVVTMALTAICTSIVMKAEIPLPGNKALAPFWFAFIYVCQFFFSMKGIKAILKLKDRPKKEKKEKKPKEPKPKKVSPVEGMEKIAHNVYRDEQGNLFNKKGEAL